MIPVSFTVIEKIPLTANGKIDTRALPDPVLKTGAEQIAPRNTVEGILAEIWTGVLMDNTSMEQGRENQTIGIDDNFFLLGGHSLKATVLTLKIHKRLNVKIPLGEVFKTPTIRALAAYISSHAEETFVSIQPTEKKSFCPLSSAQKRLYFLQAMYPDSTAYNMPEAIPIPGEPDLEKLEHAIVKLIRRHESLRTSFHILNEEPVQVIHDSVKFNPDYFETNAEFIKNQNPHDMEEIGDGLSIQNSFNRPFDLSRAPLVRTALIKVKETGDNRCFLLVDMHHIISDGLSHNILKNDFAALYQDKKLPPLRIQYKDYSIWLKNSKQKETIRRQEAYWLRELDGEIPVLDLPLDFPRPAEQTYEGAAHYFEITAGEREKLNAICAHQGVTPYMVLLAIFNVLLSKLSGGEDIIVGTPTAGRSHADLEKIIGMFVNTLALRNFPTGAKTFLQFLRQVKSRTLRVFENQDYPFEDLVDRVAVARDISRNPLFDVMFGLQSDDMSTMESTPWNREESNNAVPSRAIHRDRLKSKFDMTLNVFESEAELIFNLTYNIALFKKETIQRFAGYFKQILSTIMARQEIKLSRIPLVSGEEEQRILYEFNDTRRDLPRGKTIPMLFAEQAQRTPANVAVKTPLSHLSYGELDRQSHHLAASLKYRGIGNGGIVAVMCDASPTMIKAILAVLKAGAAYLPLDPEIPKGRLDYLLSDSQAKLLLAKKLPASAASASIACLNPDEPGPNTV
ncbi:MAG: AMP-binding protein, partial [bacterium]|nr:AMP-binding protein [bacterium]